MPTRESYIGNLPSCILAYGPDAFRFIDSQVTVKLPQPESKRWTYALWLDEKGRVMADSIVYPQSSESCLILSLGMKSSELLQVIQSNQIADQVEWEDLSEIYAAMVLRDFEQTDFEKLTLSNLSNEAGRVSESDEFICLSGVFATSTDQLIISAHEFQTQLTGVVETAFNIFSDNFNSGSFEALRTGARIPNWEKDIAGRLLPHEFNPIHHFIDYQKGCFPGQEIMARFRKGGKTNKILSTFTLDSEQKIHLPSDILKGTTKVGTITSAGVSCGKQTALGIVRTRYLNEQLHVLQGEDRLRLLPKESVES